MRYNKLVRDKIPEIIEKDGLKPLIHTANDREYWEKLKQKLLEESKEFFKKSSEEEFADILEVLDAICEFKNFDQNKIKMIKKKKAEKRGRFSKRIILDKVKE